MRHPGRVSQTYRPRAQRRRRSRTSTVIVWLLVVAVLAWASMTDLGRRPFDPRHLSLPFGREIVLGADSQTLLAAGPRTPLTQAIGELGVRESSGAGPYRRDRFGQAWADEDHNGCDTRNDILARDLQDVRFKRGTHDCVVRQGTFIDPYTGRQLDFRRGAGTSSAVQIDHVVALADAWESGAWAWSAAKRQRFANDPLNLLAVDGPANEDKGAASADQWMPPNTGFACGYIARQVAVKRQWGLSVAEPERQAMARTAASCPSQQLPTREGR